MGNRLESPGFALLSGGMIRDCIVQPVLHRLFLFAPDASIPSMTVELFRQLSSEHFEVWSQGQCGGCVGRVWVFVADCVRASVRLTGRGVQGQRVTLALPANVVRRYKATRS